MSTGLILLITGVISIGLAIVAECSTGDRKKMVLVSVGFISRRLYGIRGKGHLAAVGRRRSRDCGPPESLTNKAGR